MLLLPERATAADISALKEQANKEELNGNLEQARKLWRQINEISSSRLERREAVDAIERITKKIALPTNIVQAIAPQQAMDLRSQSNPSLESTLPGKKKRINNSQKLPVSKPELLTPPKTPTSKKHLLISKS
ncbi:MAG: hypothetical protein HC903_32075 [Methylacidiphilales bacterium]|nr:hypothetical protein [Candidatus Methylacidiphilales bacterium]